MPRPVTVSIAMGAKKGGDKDAATNNSSLASIAQSNNSAASKLPPGQPTNNTMAQSKTTIITHPPRPQSFAPINPTPPNMGQAPQSHPPNPTIFNGNPQTFNNSNPTNNSMGTAALATAAPVIRRRTKKIAKPPKSKPKQVTATSSKRTKKIAKTKLPKAAARGDFAINGSRKLPTKNRRGGASQKSPPSLPKSELKPSPPPRKLLPTAKNRGKAASASVQLKSPESLLGYQGNNAAGGVSANCILSPPRASVRTIGREGDSVDLQIRRAVSAVADTVAEAIHHCSPVFLDVQKSSRLKVTIGNNNVAQDNLRPTFKQGTEQGAQQVPHATASTNPNGNAPGSTYSIKISSNLTLHPVMKSVESPEEGISDEDDSHDVQNLVDTVRRFVLEVYCPFLISASNNMGNDTPNIDRISISTLLAIREMLIMNADKLFKFATLKKSATPNSMNESTYLSSIFANAIVQTTAKRLRFRQPGVNFGQVIQNYDAKSDDFQFSLTRADACSMYVHQLGGAPVGTEESTLAKVSFNYARAHHPLLCKERIAPNGNAKDEGIARKDIAAITRPAPTACAAFHIETASTAGRRGEEDTETKIIESLRQALRSKCT